MDSASDESQQDLNAIFSAFSNSEVVTQVSQLINWVNTYTVYQSGGDPTTKTFMDGLSLVQGLQSQLESIQKSNETRDSQGFQVNTQKSALEQENEKLRRQLKEQSAHVVKFKKRNAKLENHEKKIAIREVMPLGKLKCKVANLQLIFETLVRKLEKEPVNSDDALSVQRNNELGEFRRDVGDLFGRVQHNMIKWEKTQKEMVGKLERTRVGLNSLNETVMPRPSDVPFADLLMHSHNLVDTATPFTSTNQSAGNVHFEYPNQPAKSKAKQKLCGTSVKTALSKHIKSRNMRKSNENIGQNKQTPKVSTSTSISTVAFTNPIPEPISVNPVRSSVSRAECIARVSDDAGENIGSPQKPKSPIVCGICGSGFSTLVQLKLHHAVLHSSESSGPSVGHEHQHVPIQPQRSHAQHLPPSNEALHFADYFSARQANPGASTSAAANTEHNLMQYLMDLAARIYIPSTTDSNSLTRRENDT